MRKTVYTARFIDDVAGVYSDRLKQALDSRMSAIVTFPLMGMAVSSRSIICEFGSGVRSMPLSPFDIIYGFDEEKDVVVFRGLVHMRKSR